MRFGHFASITPVAELIFWAPAFERVCELHSRGWHSAFRPLPQRR
jgi:hypothetical protein